MDALIALVPVALALGLLGLVVVILVLAAAVFAPLVSPYDPSKIDVLHKLQWPSAAHWLGTDTLGRDLFSRILYGGRISLTVGLVATFVALTIGTFVP